MQPFTPRPVRPLGLQEHDGWTLKLYSIAHDGAAVEPAAFAEGLQLALATLPQPARAPDRPGVGFCILHRGRGADYLVLAWWDRENELPVRVFIRASGADAWRPARGGESFCVWDLQVIGFERDAYVGTILASPPASLHAYLERTLSLELPAVPSPA